MKWSDVDIFSLEELNFDNSFSLAKYVSNLSLNGKEKEAQKIIIHILSIWEKVDSTTQKLWEDLIESEGFYPYLSELLEAPSNLDTTSEIRNAYHISDYLKDVILHQEQKLISEAIKKEKNVIVSAPTSFGKSLLIQEIIASNKYNNILIIQPTLALLNETRISLRKFGNKYNIIVNTSQTVRDRNIFLLTAERVLEFKDFPFIDYFILDEFYKLSSSRDDERSDVLNIAIRKILENPKTRFYFLGPNIDSIPEGFIERYNAIFFKTNYSLVDTRVIPVEIDYKNTGVRKKQQERENELFKLLVKLNNEQSIVYISSPDRAYNIAKRYYSFLYKNKLNHTPQYLPINEWIEENIDKNWTYNKLIEQKIGVHSGIIPKHLTHSIIDYFNKGHLNVLFCTSTIIEGVNTSAKNVMIFDNKKGPNEIDYFDYSNIKGRAGRLLQHFVGNVYLFHPVPQKDSINLDIPFYDQKIITDEVLINLPKDEVRDRHVKRYKKLNDYNEDLLKIIKSNSVSVNGQKKIIKELSNTLKTNPSLILWSGLPQFKQLKYILNLCWDNLLKPTETTRPMTKNALPVVVFNNAKKDFREIIIGEMSYLKKQNPKWDKQRILDQAVSKHFRNKRHWVSYKVPKWLNIIDSLQKEICKQLGMNSTGDYSYFVSYLENEGVKPELSILLDMGLPHSAIEKITSLIPDDLPEDELIEFVRSLNIANNASLLQYEKEKIKEL